MCLPGALRYTAIGTFRSDRLSEDERATGPEEAEEEGCTHTATKEWDEC